MGSMDADALRTLEALTVSRYSERLKRLGRHPGTLGWDTEAHQRQRFAVARRAVRFTGRAVTDVGCGFGDLLSDLQGSGDPPASYTGIDINPDLLQVAASAQPAARFECRNILTDPLPQGSTDIVTLFGLLNWRLPVGNNLEHARALIRTAWDATREATIVDMLSDEADPAYPREDFVFYYRPAEMVAFALTLTPYVSLLHDYPSLPQREFMLVLRRQPCL